jgi:hypothetical protein
MNILTAEQARIFRITHIDNVPWILANGLHCRSSNRLDPNYIDIGNQDLIDKRRRRVCQTGPGGTLSDYIPFYFTPCSPMLLNIKTGYNGVKQRPMREIAILVSSLHRVGQGGHQFLFTDRHAYVQAARFSGDLQDLDWIDWRILQARDFKKDPEDPGKSERYQAEALIHRFLPASSLAGIACFGPEQKQRIDRHAEELSVAVKVLPKPEWYF